MAVQMHQSRTLVQLISIKSGSKAEFRDCSFRCAKVYQQRKNGPNSSNPAPTGQGRMRTDRSNSQYNRNRQVGNNELNFVNTSGNRADSVSAGLSEKQLNDSASIGQQANTSGRILGRYFANEKEEEQVLRENVHEVCFWMNAEAMNEHPSCLHEFSKNINRYSSSGGSKVRKKAYKGSVMLQSCVFTGFYNQIRAGCNATIEVDKCFM